MRMLHTSDWHLGRSFHGHPMLDEQRSFIDWLVGEVEAREVDVVIVAGDVYDRAVPPVDAVALWQSALERLSALATVVVISGNHDSSMRLGFAGTLLDRAGIHLRTSLASLDRPVLASGRDGAPVAIYGIPYLEPDIHRQELDAERSHAAVLAAAMSRIDADLATRGEARSIVVAHAFITGSSGASVSDSERDLRVGGVGDAPATLFGGVDYVALGHLHGAQEIRGAEGSHVRYSGSPVAFSFSEESHVKSVTILDIPGEGPVVAETVPVPVRRPLATLRGTLEELLDDPATAALGDHWVRVVLTDPRRPEDPLALLRAVLPHVAELTFDRPRAVGGPGPSRSAAALDPVDIATSFIEHVTETPAAEGEVTLVRDAVERTRVAGVSG